MYLQGCVWRVRRAGERRADPGPLSKRERLVAELAASGLTDCQIAARLNIGDRTVQTHLAHVYAKLGIRGVANLGRCPPALTLEITFHKLKNRSLGKPRVNRPVVAPVVVTARIDVSAAELITAHWSTNCLNLSVGGGDEPHPTQVAVRSST